MKRKHPRRPRHSPGRAPSKYLPYANHDLSHLKVETGLKLLEEELSRPSIRRIVDAFPGQIDVCRCGIWRWIHDLEYHHRPKELDEASEVYYANRGQFPGPVQWWEGILASRHEQWERYSLRTTIYFPVDVYGNIVSQAEEMKRVCRAMKRKLREISGEEPPRRGQEQVRKLAQNILLVVLRDWGSLGRKELLKRLGDSPSENTLRRLSVRLGSTRRLLRRHVSRFDSSRRLQK